jgi:hypothetical protein
MGAIVTRDGREVHHRGTENTENTENTERREGKRRKE